MEYQRIVNLLDKTAKVRTNNWVEINNYSGESYNTNSQIKFKTSVLK